MFEIFFKLMEALGPLGALGALAILVGLALSTGLSLDDLIKDFPYTHLPTTQKIGVILAIAGLGILVVRLKQTIEETRLRRHNWQRLITILKSHRALSVDDTPMFPNRVVQSIFLLRTQIIAYLERKAVIKDKTATRTVRKILELIRPFLSAVEGIEQRSDITLQSDNVVRIDTLPDECRKTFILERDIVRGQIYAFSLGVYFGRGETKVENFYDRISLQ